MHENKHRAAFLRFLSGTDPLKNGTIPSICAQAKAPSKFETSALAPPCGILRPRNQTGAEFFFKIVSLSLPSLLSS